MPSHHRTAGTVAPRLDDEDWFIGTFAPYLPDGPWPRRLRAVAVSGARSATNADLLEQFDVQRCIAATPIVADTPIVGEATGRVLEEEARRLRAQGMAVSVVQASDIEAEAFGFDLLDLGNVAIAIEAGRERGRQEADRLRG